MTTLIKPQGLYTVWGYWLPHGTDGEREIVGQFRYFSIAIAEANHYARETHFAQVVASSNKVVHDTRKPQERQAERCAICLTDLDRGAVRIEEHGSTFDSLACLVAFEERQAQQ